MGAGILQPDRIYNITMMTWKKDKTPVSTWQSVNINLIYLPSKFCLISS